MPFQFDQDVVEEEARSSIRMKMRSTVMRKCLKIRETARVKVRLAAVAVQASSLVKSADRAAVAVDIQVNSIIQPIFNQNLKKS